MLEYEIQAFGQRLGMSSLAFNQEGLIQLQIEELGSLFLEREEKNGRRELLIYLSAPVAEHDVNAHRRLLAHCDYRHAYPFPLSAGVFSGRAILLTHMPEEQVTASGIENALRFLAEIFYE